MTAADPSFLRERVALFAPFTEPEIVAIIKGSRVVPYSEGEMILHAGEEVHFLGVILEGEVAVLVYSGQEGDEIGSLAQGDTFGEMALISGDPALVDLRAKSLCRLLEVPLTLFQSQIMAEPAAMREISRMIGARYQALMASPHSAAILRRKDEDPEPLELRGERPERLLVVNCGSSSLKYRLFDTENPGAGVHGSVERIGLPGTRLKQSGTRGTVERELPAAGHDAAFAAMVEALLEPAAGAIGTPAEITAVGHRVVYGGQVFATPVVIDDDVLPRIEALATLAPLHNPANALGIREARRCFPSVPHVAVFDTAFHATLPAHAFLYGLPRDFADSRGLRRYGFHGPSHQYVSLAAARFLGRRFRELRLVSCHLGNGASLCAIDHGRSVDTTMGFTPGEGLVMGTRCGDIDSGLLVHLMRSEGLGPDELDELLNRRSGLLGLSGISPDLREIEAAAEEGHAGALTALKVFSYRVRKGIGALVAAMGGIDVLVFTAGIGQGSAGVRAAALQGLSCMGLHLDESRNRAADGRHPATISTDDSPVAVLVVPTDEELMIARETLGAIGRDYLGKVAETRRTERIPVEISARHIHLCQEHVEALFGPGHQLEKLSDLSQPGQYACKEQLTIAGPKGKIERVRVLGPARRATQVEIAMTEQFKLGIFPPIRESGDIEGSPGCTLEGPAGTVTIERGVICALRHIHMTPADALRFGVRDKDNVRVRIGGDREMIFGDVRIRVDPSFALAMHIDTDEGNAANLRTGATGHLEPA
jgi:acetate kinase